MSKSKKQFEYCYLSITERTNKGVHSITVTDAKGRHDISKIYEGGNSYFPILMTSLNHLGAEGWELLSIRKDGYDYYFFKRKIEG